MSMVGNKVAKGTQKQIDCFIAMTGFTFNSLGANGSFVHLWTINARGIWKTITESRVRCIDFSCAPEGVSVNVVVAGLENGIIRFALIFHFKELTAKV